jgi:hypothetical protein
MSFGFSVGDFITISKLIAEITGGLKDAGGAKSEYQELLRALKVSKLPSIGLIIYSPAYLPLQTLTSLSIRL